MKAILIILVYVLVVLLAVCMRDVVRRIDTLEENVTDIERRIRNAKKKEL